MSKRKYPSHLFRVCTFHNKVGMMEWLMKRADKPTMLLSARLGHIARYGFPPESNGPVRHYPELSRRY